MKADYMATGTSTVWDKCDYKVEYSSRWPHMRALQEFLIFWGIVAKYEIIHSHFMIMLTDTGWELPLLKKMGRRIVIHYRGCEARDREKNIRLHPDLNICQECDYGAYCEANETIKKRRMLAKKYGDLFLCTTPDMKDFIPDAIHLPFFAPEIDYNNYKASSYSRKDAIKIVHVTNHPGIEGTKEIQRAIDNLITEGYKIDFVFLQSVAHDVVFKELVSADLSIGKMRMGYYANAQIESMIMGVPAVTYVRPEFMTEELKKSGFIFSDLKNLEKTLKYYLDNPDKLYEKRKIARKSILVLHDNEKLAKQLIEYYYCLKNRDGEA